MAQVEYTMTGDFDAVLNHLDQEILQGSISCSLEGSSDWSVGTVRCAVRVYERYSMMGGNRLSLSLTLLGEGEQIRLSAITAGGSQAVIWKINTLGESSFLEALKRIVEMAPAREIRERGF